ncbi:MAG: DoxX family protein [Bacteroidia bacterium]|nr:DoxX family protein [Bacteroidia bacterium]
MDYLIIVLQLVVALSLINVWLVQNKKPTRWRGGEAKTLLEEFKVYGLPSWSCYVVGIFKVGLAMALIAGIWFPDILKPVALGLAFFLFGSIVMHLKVKDPLIKSFPAALFLVLCLVIAFA